MDYPTNARFEWSRAIAGLALLSTTFFTFPTVAAREAGILPVWVDISAKYVVLVLVVVMVSALAYAGFLWVRSRIQFAREREQN